MATIRILTLNIWFKEYEKEKRMALIAEIIASRSPDMVALQEMTDEHWQICCSHEAFQKYSWSSPPAGQWYYTLIGSLVPFRETPVRRAFRVTNMGRDLHYASINARSASTLMFATSHLESLDRAEERQQQIAEAMQVFSKDDDVVFCGDTNVNEAYDGEIVLPEDWKDAWTVLRPSEPGFTFDVERNTMMAKQDSGWAVANHALLRFDRFWVKLKHYTPIEIELIDDSVDGNLWPSDHFGLLLTLAERQHDSQAEVPQLASQFAPQFAPEIAPPLASQVDIPGQEGSLAATIMMYGQAPDAPMAPPVPMALLGQKAHSQPTTAQADSPCVYGRPAPASGRFTASLCVEEADVLHVRILHLNGTAVSWQEALAELLNPGPSDFRNLLTRVLREHVPFEAYFWECAPVRNCELLRNLVAFEFALKAAPCLARNSADITDFKDYLENVEGQSVMKVFQNPSRDSSLVAPALATSDPEDYTHIAAFFRGNAPPSQRDAAWQALGRAISEELGTRDVVWVSTDGRSVHWLHFRVDSRPKYFKIQRYRDSRFGL
jgi:endonuclease/exonuclease/phosphatase family metal-dependent hydrolase